MSKNQCTCTPTLSYQHICGLRLTAGISTYTPGYTAWDLKSHHLGKVYDLTQANMNAMIKDIETLAARIVYLGGKK